MNSDHKKWADLVIKGVKELDAYLRVYPNASKKTAANQLGTFRKNVGLQDYIRKGSQRIADIVDNKHIENLVNTSIGEILTAAKKREILAQIVLGQIETEKYVSHKGELKKVKCKPDFGEMMKAIELDNKMTGENVLAKPNQTAKAEEVTKVVIVEDARDGKNLNG